MVDMFSDVLEAVYNAATTSGGCRVDEMLGSSVPTFMAAWWSIMLVLLVQYAANIVMLQDKIRRFVLSKLGILESVEKLEKVRSKTRALRDKAKSAASTAEGGMEDVAAAVKAKVLARFKASFNTTKEYSAMCKVINLMFTIVLFFGAVYGPAAWNPKAIADEVNPNAMADEVGNSEINAYNTTFTDTSTIPNGTDTSATDSQSETAALQTCVGSYIWDGVSGLRIGVGTGHAASFAPPPPPPPAMPPPPSQPPPPFIPPTSDSFDMEDDSSYVYPWLAPPGGDSGMSWMLWCTMILRVPLAPKLSVLWMVLIGSMGTILTAEREAVQRYRDKGRTLTTVCELLRVNVGLMLIPIIVLLSFSAFLSIVIGGVFMVMMYDMAFIWFALLSIVLVRVPCDVLWRLVGCDVDPPDLTGFENVRVRRWLMIISCSRYFKYYFTALMQVANVVLQLRVSYAALEAIGARQPNAFAEYIKHESDTGTLPGKLVQDYFTLTTEPYPMPNLNITLPDFDVLEALAFCPLFDLEWWSKLFDVSIPAFFLGFPQIDIWFPGPNLDIRLMMYFDVAYFSSFVFFVLEYVSSFGESILEECEAMILKAAAAKAAVSRVRV